jgi:hypothetical protein
MRAARSPSEVNSAIQSLFRVSGTELKTDASGLRPVWHHGATGAELMSYVDPKGHLVRQEFTLFDEHFLWTSDRGLRTGVVGEEYGTAVKGTPEVTFDREPLADRIERANEALGAYSGEDRYILHLKRIIALMLQGLQTHDEESVTSVQEQLGGAGRRPSSPGSGNRSMMFAVIAAAVVAALGVAAALLLK